MAYSEPAAVPATTVSYDPNGQFLYSAPAVATLPSQAHSVPASPPESNPHQSFAPAGHPAATGMHSPNDMWARQQHHPHANGAPNTWQQWTTSVVDQPERYGANALMSLGASRPAASDHHAYAHAGASPPMHPMGSVDIAQQPQQQPAHMQWPLILFSDGSSHGHSLSCS